MPHRHTARSGDTARRIARAAAGVVLVVCIVAGAAGLWRSAAAQRVASAQSAFAIAVERLLSTLKDIETGSRGYILVGSEDYLAPYNGSLDQLEPQIAATLRDAAEAAATPRVESHLVPAVRAKVAFTTSTVEARRDRSYEAARALIETGRGKELMDVVRGEVSDLQAVAHRRETLAHETERLNAMLAALAFLGLLGSTAYFAYAGIVSRRESRQSDEALARVIANAPVGLGFVDPEHRLIRRNEALSRILEGKSSLEGSLLSRTVPDFYAQVRGELDRLQQPNAEPAAPLEVETEREDGPGYLKASFFRIGSRRDRGIGMVVADVTEERRWQHELQAARDHADAANRAKSAFLANMSHELRTPLSAVIGYCELLEDELEELGEKGLLRDLGKINSNARHLLKLINDVLDLSKIEAQKMEVHAETIQVGALVSDVEAAVGSLIGKKGNRLEIVDAAGGSIVSDELKIRQILLNLLGNAAKFTENGVIALAVERHGTEAGETIRFTVRDDGIGMTPEQVSNLFERFVQADETTTRRFGGTGLGLALTKALVSMLGGTITVESEPGRGSSFTVELPVDHARVAAAAEEEAPASREPGDRRRSILVIDDDPSSREFLARFLAREGYVVEQASSGQDGLRKARAMRPLAILLDVTMPGIDGWEVLREIRNDPVIGETPVVMQTVIDEQVYGYALGATDYLLKPIDRALLRASLARLGQAETARTILVVDDDADARDRVGAALRREGWEVETAPGGEAALASLKQRLPSLVLLDLMMPGMDGYAFIREVRANPDWAALPIVVLTAADLSDPKVRALDETTARVVQKGSQPLGELAADLRSLAAADPDSTRPSS